MLLSAVTRGPSSLGCIAPLSEVRYTHRMKTETQDVLTGCFCKCAKILLRLPCSSNRQREGAICLMFLSPSAFAIHLQDQTTSLSNIHSITLPPYQNSNQDEDISVSRSQISTLIISPTFITRWPPPIKLPLPLQTPTLQPTQIPLSPFATSISATLPSTAMDKLSSPKSQTSRCTSIV
jgi:hypothetical protein